MLMPTCSRLTLVKKMLFWLNRVLPQVALWGKGILCLQHFCCARNMFRTVAIRFRTFTIALQSQQKVPLLGINAIVSLLYNPTKITQSNRHLTTTQSCQQYPNQELLLQYPMLETHGSWLVM